MIEEHMDGIKKWRTLVKRTVGKLMTKTKNWTTTNVQIINLRDRPVLVESLCLVV